MCGNSFSYFCSNIFFCSRHLHRVLVVVTVVVTVGAPFLTSWSAAEAKALLAVRIPLAIAGSGHRALLLQLRLLGMKLPPFCVDDVILAQHQIVLVL
jgi:hypothetical protein